MQNRPFTYLFWIQYLGLRYHGWQRQPGVKTVQGILERSIRYVLGHEDFTVLGASRTDSGVSCLKGAFELFLPSPLDPEQFLKTLNENLPSDIRILQGQKVPLDFNVIHHVVEKQYGYYFAVGEKPHPFWAGSLAYAGRALDIPLMQKGARLFVGKHDFRRFCSHGKHTDDFVREVVQAEISKAGSVWGGVLADNMYVFRVRAGGFLMHQVRRMMAALILLGKREISLEDISQALVSLEKSAFPPKAPANGLVLEEVVFSEATKTPGSPT
ncbi:tRNA pseudouridine(38-40) synthase TruA [Negadavirga shengliensis]|uniref:tRNA pseudouridine synthase A n=1 Tax=Negadavirga shengliensis TaxID=1389218 RepID=A0ABV9T747_9BACT